MTVKFNFMLSYMYLTCILHVSYMYPTCILHVSYMYLTCILHVSYMYLTCILHVSYMCLTCILHVSYMYPTCILHVSYMYLTCILHVFMACFFNINTCKVLSILNYWTAQYICNLSTYFAIPFERFHMFICMTIIKAISSPPEVALYFQILTCGIVLAIYIFLL